MIFGLFAQPNAHPEHELRALSPQVLQLLRGALSQELLVLLRGHCKKLQEVVRPAAELQEGVDAANHLLGRAVLHVAPEHVELAREQVLQPLDLDLEELDQRRQIYRVVALDQVFTKRVPIPHALYGGKCRRVQEIARRKEKEFVLLIDPILI